MTNPAPIVDTIPIDQPVPNAPLENLWVIDGCCSIDLINALTENIDLYFKALTDAQVVSTGILISANAKKWEGIPINSQSGSPLLAESSSTIMTDWDYRLKLIDIALPPLTLKIPISPLWAMHLFYQQLPTSSIYHKTYMMPQVPMEVVIAATESDNYKNFTKDMAPSDFATAFIQFHKSENKAFHVNAVGASTSSVDGDIGERKR